MISSGAELWRYEKPISAFERERRAPVRSTPRASISLVGWREEKLRWAADAKPGAFGDRRVGRQSSAQLWRGAPDVPFDVWKVHRDAAPSSAASSSGRA